MEFVLSIPFWILFYLYYSIYFFFYFPLTLITASVIKVILISRKLSLPRERFSKLFAIVTGETLAELVIMQVILSFLGCAPLIYAGHNISIYFMRESYSNHLVYIGYIMLSFPVLLFLGVVMTTVVMKLLGVVEKGEFKKLIFFNMIIAAILPVILILYILILRIALHFYFVL